MSVVGEDGKTRRLSQREVAAKLRTTPSLAAAATAAGLAAPSQPLQPAAQEQDLLGAEMEEDEPTNVIEPTRKRYHMQARANQMRQNAPPSYVVRSTEPPRAAGPSIQPTSRAPSAPPQRAPQPGFGAGSAYTQPMPSLESQPYDLGMDSAVFAAFNEANTTMDASSYSPMLQGGAPPNSTPYQNQGAFSPQLPPSPLPGPGIQRSRRLSANMSPSSRSSAQFEPRRRSWQDAAADSRQARPASYQPPPVMQHPQQYAHQAPQLQQSAFAAYPPAQGVGYRPDGTGTAYGRRYQNTGALQHPPSSQRTSFDYQP